MAPKTIIGARKKEKLIDNSLNLVGIQSRVTKLGGQTISAVLWVKIEYDVIEIVCQFLGKSNRSLS